MFPGIGRADNGANVVQYALKSVNHSLFPISDAAIIVLLAH